MGMTFSDTLWDRIRLAVRHRIGRRVRNAFDADDLTQDSLLVAYLKSDGIDSDRSLEIYTHKVSRWHMANYTRRQKNAALRFGSVEVESVAQAGIPPEDAYAYQELVAILVAFAATLRPQEKTLLRLLLRGASGQEICLALQITPPARNLLTCRLRRKLKQALAAKGYFKERK